MTAVAIDESACRRGHDYLTIAADADERKLVFVIEERDATTIARFAEHLATHKARPEQITTMSIDMSPAFIRGVADHLPEARVTFNKFHVVALDQTSRLEQRRDPSLKGLRWTLLKDRQRLSAEARADLDALISHAAITRLALSGRTASHPRLFDGIVAWIQTRQTNGFIEALNGLFQAAKRKARLHPLLPPCAPYSS